LGNLEEGLSTGTLRVRRRGFVSMTLCAGNAVLRRRPQYHILCECEVLASLKHAYLGSFFLDPEDIRELGMGVIWNFPKGTGLL